MDTDQALLEDETDAEASVESEGQQAEADPQAELVARLSGLEAEIGRLKGLDPNKIGPAIGRVAAIQSQLDAIKDRNPAADLDPRISANENLTVTLAQALAGSDLVDDRFKQALTSALTGIDQARTERQQRQLEASLEEKISKKFAQAQPEPDADETPWAEATDTVLPLAQKLGIDPTTVPWQAIRTAAGTPARAAAMATQWLYENQTDPATQRVAARQQAAGGGSPKPGGSGNSHSSMDEAYEAYNNGTITGKQLDAYRTRFGVAPF